MSHRCAPRIENSLSPCILGSPQNVPSAPGLHACLLPRSRAAHHMAIYQPCCGPIKLQSLSLTGCKNSWKSAHLIFLATGFEYVFSWNHLCTFLFLSHLSPQPGVPPLWSTCDLFLLQTTSLHLLPSSNWPLFSLLLCGLFYQSSVWFLDYSEWFYSYLAVFKEQGKPGVLLQCHHLIPSLLFKKLFN